MVIAGNTPKFKPRKESYRLPALLIGHGGRQEQAKLCWKGDTEQCNSTTQLETIAIKAEIVQGKLVPDELFHMSH